MVLSYFKQTRPDCNIESNVTTGRQKKIGCFSVDGFVTIVTLSLKQWVVISTTVYVKKLARLWLTTKLKEGSKLGNKSECAKNIRNRKDTKLLKCGSANGENYTELMQQ